MSLGLHRRWKRKAVQLAGLRPGHVVLDLAAGTGDLALAAARQLTGREAGDFPGPGLVLAGDLAMPMMRVGRRRREAGRVAWVACDALSLPLPDASVDRVLIGYGLRNFPDLEVSLLEIRRCLRPGGRLVTLDFGKPSNPLFRRGYLRYLEVSTRAVGWLLHRDAEAYLYIPESLRQFPGQRGVADLMGRLGFVRYGFLEFLWGAMAINFGDRPE